MNFKKLILFASAALICLPSFSHAQFYTGSQMEFGKNRIQYRDFKWTFFGYDKYEIYFYEGGMELAKYVSKSAKKNLDEIEKLYDYNMDLSDKIQFIIYNKQSEFAQTNVGYSSDEQYNIGGVTRIVGSKVILYFEGDHEKLDQQVRAGIAEVLLNHMMYGGGVRDVVKNSTLLNLPEWFSKGLISYVSSDWNTDLDNRVKDGILSGKFKKFNRLSGYDAVAAGHAIWYYIAQTYGESVVSNILYMTKVSRSVENAFLFVLGASVKDVTYEWMDSYKERYKESAGMNLPAGDGVLRKPKSTRVYNQMKLSPDGSKLIYATNEMGQYKVWLYDMASHKSKRIIKKGVKLDRVVDYSYPLLAWHPSGKYFSMITEKKGSLTLTQYILETKEKSERNILNFEKILDFSYSDDGKKFAISAVQNGQSDIFVLAASSNAFEQITKDLYDDVQPRFVNNSSRIIFCSNRPDDTLRFVTRNKVEMLPPTKDVFLVDYVSRSQVLKRLTNTPLENETFPAAYDSIHYTFLSDRNGIRNRYLSQIDSVISFVDTSSHYRYVMNSFPITNYSRNIIEHNPVPSAGKISEVIFYKGKYRLYNSDMQPSTSLVPIKLNNTFYKTFQARLAQKEDSIAKATVPVVTLEKVNKPAKDTTKKAVDINNYSFEDDPAKNQKKDGNQAEVKKEENDTTAAVDKEDEFRFSKQRNYNTNFFTDYIVTQLDNSFLNSSYQKFTPGGGPLYLNPGFNGLFKIGISDLFENYRITGGIRLAWDLNSNEYFLSYENRVKRLDRQVVLHRQALLSIVSNAFFAKVHTHEAKYVLKWPFSEVSSVRGSVNLRNDNTTFLSTDFPSLKKANESENWGGLKGEFVFDNTISKGLNLYNGLRLKVFFEYNRQVERENTDLFVTGFDVRHYQKVHRDIIWANRLAASTSFGKQKLIYYMGGVDNWFNPRFDQTINIATDQNYAYQTLATNMRGFIQNIRNGNSFAVINSELRIPLFRYLLNRPIRSDFINNFQVVGFGDLGTAWTGWSPYSEENSLNKIIHGSPGNPITVILNSHKEPIVGGYGFGLRSRIAGYFVRVDWAWGVEDKFTLPRIVYLSFSLDF